MLGRIFGGGDCSKKKPASWRDGPATLVQKSWAIELGIPFPPDITKGDLSDLIDKKEQAAKKRTGGVIRKLRTDIARLKKEVSGLKKTRKTAVKKVFRKKKK
jgi:hypothetical protein